MKCLRFMLVVFALLLLPAFGSAKNLDSIIVLQAKQYYAEISPAFGGNCIRLKHLPSGIEVLRTPKSRAEFVATPELFGMPILFFPNRIHKGRFFFEGREYLWPINEPKRDGYVHGTLFHTAFKVLSRTDSSVKLVFEATKKRPYLNFPHAFRLQLYYWIDNLGLHQEVTVKNNSDMNMPFGLSFHTTFNLPFVPGSKPEKVKLQLPVGKLYPRDEKFLTPTGEVLDCFALKTGLRSGNLVPVEHILSDFYSSDGGAMKLIDSSAGWSVNYSADSTHKFWMLWNGGRKDLVVVEPQTCLIDAYNVNLPKAEKGEIIIKPGDEFKNRTNIQVMPIKRPLKDL